MGSRFIASNESEFSSEYKGIVPSAKAQDTILVTGSLGPIRLWKNEYSLHHGLVADKEAKIAQEEAMSQSELVEEMKAYEAAYKGDITHYWRRPLRAEYWAYSKRGKCQENR
ncbi:MAG: hypothetical protein ACXAES_16825 [Promethearchaeota archaeon]